MTVRMTRRGVLCGCCGLAAAPLAAMWAQGARAAETRPDFVFEELRPGIWRHTSWSTLPNGAYFPSNGMVVVGGKRALMIDTAWTPDQTELLLGLMSPIVDARPVDLFVTHFHDDRLGGLSATARRAIPSHAFEATVREAAKHDKPAIDRALKPTAHVFDLGGRAVEVFYPGPGHTIDNAVAHDRQSNVVFGGCMIRFASATDLGNTADAVVGEWAKSVARVAARYPNASVVIPGHGRLGDSGLFEHTIKLASGA